MLAAGPPICGVGSIVGAIVGLFSYGAVDLVLHRPFGALSDGFLASATIGRLGAAGVPLGALAGVVMPAWALLRFGARLRSALPPVGLALGAVVGSTLYAVQSGDTIVEFWMAGTAGATLVGVVSSWLDWSSDAPDEEKSTTGS